VFNMVWPLTRKKLLIEYCYQVVGKDMREA